MGINLINFNVNCNTWIQTIDLIKIHSQ